MVFAVLRSEDIFEFCVVLGQALLYNLVEVIEYLSLVLSIVLALKYMDLYVVAVLSGHFPALSLGGHLPVIRSNCNSSHIHHTSPAFQSWNYFSGGDSFGRFVFYSAVILDRFLTAVTQLILIL